MVEYEELPDLAGCRVLVPGGTGGVGEGIVRSFLTAGAVVVVPTRSEGRSEDFRQTLGAAATDNLRLMVHDYTNFAGAADLAERVERDLGGIDHVVAPIGGWRAGGRLVDITEIDWRDAFVALAQLTWRYCEQPCQASARRGRIRRSSETRRRGRSVGAGWSAWSKPPS